MAATLLSVVLGTLMFAIPASSPLEFPTTQKLLIFSILAIAGVVSYFLVGQPSIQSKGRKLILAMTILAMLSVFIHFIFTDVIAITLLLIFSPVLYYIVSQK